MSVKNSEDAPRKSVGAIRHKAARISQENLVSIRLPVGGTPIPIIVEPVLDGVSLDYWAKDNSELIETLLREHGALLFRNFEVMKIAQFESVISVICGELIDYTYRSTPRRRIDGKIFTSTEYPADQQIPLHNEMAYARQWPMKVFFFCIKTAARGGETPLADSRKVIQRINRSLVEEFERKQLLYVRNYGTGLDLRWQEVFQTENKAEVELYCQKSGIEVEWKDNDQLRTRQICQACATHPATGAKVWFNQAHLFHVSGLSPSVLNSLRGEFTDDELPRNVYFGDGSSINDSMLEEIRSAYAQETVIFPWMPGDILLLDNMLTAHGRMPFEGLREVVVGMGQPFSG